ncbi:hypothetical protein [Streptomyces sp. 6-11-2]|nr:hypothetical protein [Streptomyces sp. 6-11-2]
MTNPAGPGPGRPDPGLDAIMSERHQLRIMRIWAVLNPDKLRPWTAR